MKKRTKIMDISAVGLHLAEERLAAVVGGMKCSGDTPYPEETQTLNSRGMPDTATDCSSSPH